MGNETFYLDGLNQEVYWLVFLAPFTDQNGRFPNPFIYFN